MSTKMMMMGVALCGATLVGSALAEGTVAKSVVAVPAAPAVANPAVSQKEKIDGYINGNLFGIQNVKKDASKRIVSVVSIGRAPLSSALTKARAKNQAFKKADANARAEFMKWLTTQVVYTRIDQDDVAIAQKGESLGDSGKGTASEKAEATELSQEQVVSVAAGFVKGMVQIGAGINEDGEAVVVLGWSADTAAQLDTVRDQNVPRTPVKAGPAQSPAVVPAVAPGATARPARKTSISDAAGDFL